MRQITDIKIDRGIIKYPDNRNYPVPFGFGADKKTYKRDRLFTDQQIRDIRHEVESHEGNLGEKGFKMIGVKYGVSASAIREIAKGKSYKDVQ